MSSACQPPTKTSSISPKQSSDLITMIVSYFTVYLNILSDMDNNSHYDPRFYYIQINSLSFRRELHEDVVLLFKLGGKISESVYKDVDFIASQYGFQLRHDEAAKEVHILKYGAEQFLNIYLKEGSKMIGYSRVLLPPIFELPHVKHQVNAVIYENIFQSDENKHEANEAALLNFDIYFQFNFSGVLQIIPVSAHLERNLAQIGEMRPKVKFTFEGQEWHSLPAEGGIHPHWTGHFHTNKSNGGFIASIEDNLKSNKLEEWARLIRMASNRLGFQREEELKRSNMRNQKGENVPYFDCTEFRMQSAGSHLEVEIITDPFIGSKPELVGSARIRVQDAGFLKHPRKAQEKFFEEQLVNLVYNSAGEQMPAGVLKLYVRFVFDPEKVTAQNFTRCDLD